MPLSLFVFAVRCGIRGDFVSRRDAEAQSEVARKGILFPAETQRHRAKSREGWTFPGYMESPCGDLLLPGGLFHISVHQDSFRSSFGRPFDPFRGIMVETLRCGHGGGSAQAEMAGCRSEPFLFVVFVVFVLSTARCAVSFSATALLLRRRLTRAAVPGLFRKTPG